MQKKMQRRNFLGNSAAGAGAMLLGSSLLSQTAEAKGTKKAAKLPKVSAKEKAALKALEQLIAPYTVGSVVAHGFVIQDLKVSGTWSGNVILKAQDGGTFQVDICRRGPQHDGISTTKFYSLYLRNGGDGGKQTHEDHGIAVMRLGNAVKENESTAPRLNVASKNAFWTISV